MILCRVGSHTVETTGVRIKRAPQPGGGNPSKPQSYGSAPSRRESSVLSFTQYCRTKSIGHYDATILRDQRDRKSACYGEVQAIDELPITRPFLIGAEIGYRALDFDGDYVPSSAKSEDIGTASICQREFDKTRVAELVESAAHAAGKQHGIGAVGKRWLRGPKEHDRIILRAAIARVLVYRSDLRSGVN